jgi:hypothetical protein
MKGTVRDEEKFFICIDQALEEGPHVGVLFDILPNVLADNSMHHGMARSDGVLPKFNKTRAKKF